MVHVIVNNALVFEGWSALENKLPCKTLPLQKGHNHYVPPRCHRLFCGSLAGLPARSNVLQLNC